MHKHCAHMHKHAHIAHVEYEYLEHSLNHDI